MPKVIPRGNNKGMFAETWATSAIIALVAVLLYAVIGRKWNAWRGSKRARKRGARAVRGERRAEKLLESHGYEILERQLRTAWTIECDDGEHEFDLRADLLVQRDGREFIAEVKTGDAAPDLRNASTRRQLLEYAVAYNSPTILLVDVESRRIQEVYFPLPTDHGKLLAP